jgi:hypothetical protein
MPWNIRYQELSLMEEPETNIREESSLKTISHSVKAYDWWTSGIIEKQHLPEKSDNGSRRFQSWNFEVRMLRTRFAQDSQTKRRKCCWIIIMTTNRSQEWREFAHWEKHEIDFDEIL